MRNLDKRIKHVYFTPKADTISYYLTDISKYKVKSDSDIRVLLEKYKRGDKKAFDEVINSNQRFIFSLAKKFSGGDIELLSDLINEANVGLIKAIPKFDLYGETKFLSYAVYWMQREILQYLNFVNPMIKISNKGKTNRVPDIKSKFYLKNGRNPEPHEILDELKEIYGVDITNEKDVYQLNTISITNPIISDNYDDFSSFFCAFGIESQDENSKIVSYNNYDDNSDDDYSKVLIAKSFEILTAKERNVIELLYGIGDYREYEISEVAFKMGISKEGVRLINKRALEKLKSEIMVKQLTV